MLKQEEFEALLERESVADFIWIRSWEDVAGSNIGIYEMANERWGCIFQIFPPVYAGPDTENRLSSFFLNGNLPNKSSIQFLAFPSRNLTAYREEYLAIHTCESDIDNKDVLLELKKNRSDWINKHSNESIFDKGNDLRLRNFVNLVCVTVPRNKKKNIEYSKSELVTIFSKVEQSLNDFRPMKFSRRQLVTLMREILIPDSPLWYPPDDNMSFINTQCVDNDSVLVLEDETQSIGLGHKMTKAEYIKMQTVNVIEEEEEDDKTEKKGFFENLFGGGSSKKEATIAADREAFTKWHARVYTTKMFPRTISLSGMTSKFYDYLGARMSPTIPCPFILSMIVYYEGTEKIKKEVSEKVQWNLWQTQSLGSAARFFPEILERAKEAELINQRLHEGEAPLYVSWACTLMDDSLEKVTEYGEILKKEFNSDNWILQEEVLIPHWIFLYHLPLNFEPYVLKDLSKRMNTLFNSNAAAITPIITGEKGIGKPVLTYIDRGGQIAGVDIFKSPTNYNFVVIGSSGSGKSYTMADFFTNYLMTGAKIRVIDVGRSYKEICDRVGGQYIEFVEEAPVCLNFFTNINLNSQGGIHEDEMQTVVPLVALMAMTSVSPEDADDIKVPVISGYISKAVTLAFSNRNRNAGMQDVVEALEQIQIEQKNNGHEADITLQDLINALYSFGHPDGEYYIYFNGENNLKFRSDFVVLELEELDSKEHLKSVVLAAITHAINNEFFLGDKSQQKILAIDEAWSIMDNKIVVRFLETMARRIRKYNGASGIITQGIADFYKNKATEAIFNSSAWKFFLQQSEESISAATAKGELALDDFLIAMLTTVKTKTPYYSEVLIKNDAGVSFIGRLITDPVSHWISTNHPSDMKVAREIAERFGVSISDAKIIKGYSIKNKSSEAEEHRKRLEEGKLDY